MWLAILTCAIVAAWLQIVTAQDQASFRFAILGDRTGEAQPGVYEQVWREIAPENPAFAISAGDTIQGLNDAATETEWGKVEQILKPYRRIPIYFTPGNHDIWSPASERAFRKHVGHPPRHSFDYGQAHFTILDNSRSDELSPENLTFLENDLRTHQSQPVKFILSHRPSWLINVALRSPNFRLHRLARQYHVQYVIAGHVHQMLRFELEGITYLSMASSGGHLRASQDYASGWFFGHALVQVRGGEIGFEIKELKPPHGTGRVSKPPDWGALGLIEKHQTAPAGTVR
jgi:UDP-2,3-diacylglucosamine pyrophosphatase LpxH